MPGLSEAFDRIGAFLELRLPQMHAAGAALAVTDRDELLGVVVRGFADAGSATAVRPRTRFQIGSISKSFASIVAIQEAEAGRLDLHASVNDLLPWLELPEPFGPITPHHLITHTSGLVQGIEDAPTALGAAWQLRELRPGFAPGEAFWYSNHAYKLLGLVLERTTRTPFDELLRERVLAPLGMSATQGMIDGATRTDLATGYQPIFDDRPWQATHPLAPAPWLVSNTADGSIVSDAVDMGAYMRMLLGGGAAPEGRVLSEEGFVSLTRPVIEDPERPGFSYAYGLWVGESEGRSRIRHSGGMVGFCALMTLEPDEGLGCVMLVNGEGEREATVDFALEAVRAALCGGALPEVTEPADPADVPNAGDYAGTYRNDARSIEVTASGEHLHLREGPIEAGLLRDGDSRDAFLVAHPLLDRFRLTFGRDEGGSVVEAFRGGDWLVGARFEGSPPEAPAGWNGYPGVYRSNDPWMPVVRVSLRKGELWCSFPWEENRLVPLEDGSFRLGEDTRSPDRIRFDRPVEGRTSRALLDGGAWYRSFEV